MTNESVAKLARALKERYGHIIAKGEYLWPEPALKVIDCVLSLNRRYYAFVVPRVKKFATLHPEVTSLVQLRQVMDRHATPAEFCIQELDYRDEQRAEVLRAVVEYLLKVQGGYSGETERERLRSWALSVTPDDSARLGIKGFGLAGFQYLRMLFGAQTTKPDVHLIRFVADVTGKRMTDRQTLDLLERAALRAGVPLREVDLQVWHEWSG
jgi:hypothetical protein